MWSHGSVVVLSFILILDGAEFSDVDLFKTSVQTLGMKLMEIADTTLDPIETPLKTVYQGFLADGTLILTDIDRITMTKTMADQLTNEVFDKKIKALEKLVTAASNYSAEHNKSDSFPDGHEGVTAKNMFYNAKAVNLSGLQLEYDDLFDKEVSFSSSTVHVPTEIYEGDTTLLNGIEWSSRLEQVFKENREADEDLLWQYFGSQDGFLRSYPGSAWLNQGVDLYDARRRPWYAQGSSSPKDMLILMDSSGSTKGQVHYLMRLTVRTLLETLGEDDFVDVASYAKEAKRVTPCFDSFVQANSLNKQMLNQAIEENIKIENQSNYTVALEYAFKAFEDLNKSREARNQTDNCHKLIMILSDGGTERPENLIKEHDPDGTKYRIFTYAVGQTPVDKDVMRWLACSHRGYFSKIESIGDIRSSVQQYEVVIAGPDLGTSSIKETTTSGQGMGGGMLTTLTKPVFSLSEEGDSSQLLGVMAVDISIDELESKTPYTKLSANGYAFAVNHNGYVIFHPWLKEQEQWQKDPPNIDLQDLEYENSQIEELRTLMIDAGETNVAEFLDVSNIQRYGTGQSKYYRIEQQDFYYINVSNSSFSLAIAIPKYLKKYPVFSIDSTRRDSALDFLSEASDAEFFLAPRKYCRVVPGTSYVSHLRLTVEALVNESACDANMSLHLYADALAFSQVEFNAATLLTDTVTQVFATTVGGLLRMIPEINGSAVTENPQKSNRSNIYTFYQNLSQMAHASEGVTLFLPHADRSNATEDGFWILRAVSANQNYSTSVVGASVVQSVLSELVQTACESVANSTYVCYLLDEGGYVLADTDNSTDEGNTTGLFLGKVDAHLMQILINHTVFESKEYLDYQGVCQRLLSTAKSAGHRITSIFWNVYQVFMWQISTISQLCSGIYSLLFTGLSSEFAEAALNEKKKSVTCIRRSVTYAFNRDQPTEQLLNVTYDDVERSVLVEPINGTNLVLVAVTPVDETSLDQSYAVPHEPQEMTPEMSDEKICHKTPRHRATPAGSYCVPILKTEKHVECGASSLSSRSLLLVPFLIATRLYS